MTKFRLKKEARQFFKKETHDDILSLERWQDKMIHENLLEEVENVYVEAGMPLSENSTSLRGWENNNDNPRARFHFTVHISDIDIAAYDKIDTAEIMDEIQKVLNDYFKR